ncbi:MAG: LacI family DNA-binding transcriptional regulator [Bacteroidales bacterium]|nr:LacI family DNA-binding transcriptional regulator [Bacteroidales bacterium]
MKPVTIKDVAQEAGVSTTLVSRVLNAEMDEQGRPVCAVNKATAARIMEVVNRLGYRPNTAAASLRKKRGNRIGVILPDLSHHFFALMARQFEMMARQNGYTVLFGSSGDMPDRIDNLAATFLQDNADGIILIPGIGCREVVESIVRRRIPLTLVVRDIPGLEQVGRVLTDNAAGTKLALDHLIGQGFQKIEMISSTLRISNNEERERLYEAYMAEAGRESRILHCDHTRPQESMTFILEDAMRRGVDAFYCPNSSLPLFCARACAGANISIPDDLAVMGYDGGDIFDITTPTITQISYSMKEVAEEAFRVLTARIQDFSMKPMRVVVPPSLKVGGSTQKAASVQGTSDSSDKPVRQLREAVRMLQDLEPFLQNK